MNGQVAEYDDEDLNDRKSIGSSVVDFALENSQYEIVEILMKELQL